MQGVCFLRGFPSLAFVDLVQAPASMYAHATSRIVHMWVAVKELQLSYYIGETQAQSSSCPVLLHDYHGVVYFHSISTIPRMLEVAFATFPSFYIVALLFHALDFRIIAASSSISHPGHMATASDGSQPTAAPPAPETAPTEDIVS